jgi:hypothetical protein
MWSYFIRMAFLYITQNPTWGGPHGWRGGWWWPPSALQEYGRTIVHDFLLGPLGLGGLRDVLGNGE